MLREADVERIFAVGDGLHLGVDIGSVSVKYALLDRNGEILHTYYVRHHGEPLRVVFRALRDIFDKIPLENFQTLVFTGTGGVRAGGVLGSPVVNEILANTKSAHALLPEVRTVIDIGGEDAKLIILRYDEDLDDLLIEDFAMNTICAAGTGSFLDQQASRLGVSIEEFGELALRSKEPPRIAGRCSVFAKSDMIHLQQVGTPDYDIIAGLCYAMARNFKSTLAKGKTLHPIVAFHGGVAANKGMVRAMRDVLELDESQFVVPPNHALMCAIGAAIYGRENPEKCMIPADVRERLEDLLALAQEEGRRLERLQMAEASKNVPEFQDDSPRIKQRGTPDKPLRVYIGIDVGSISTNVVAIDENYNLVARKYLLTAGRPLEAVREGIARIGEDLGEHVEVLGVGTTGSGRYLIGDFVGADIVRNEITAQATGAISIDPQVDTVFEIGGQDSKYISIRNGAVVDFEMNKVCAAGTGSFLEEQAERLGVAIKGEFGRLALKAERPCDLGERCTVFMESNLVAHQQKGASKEDLIAGLCYSIVQNYLNRVVGRKPIGNRIFFQGAVAYNKGVVAAFEKVLGKKIIVPPNHDVTGAIGIAICAAKEKTWEKSKFKGFRQIAECKYSLESFVCQDCPNHCEIHKVEIEGETPLYYGSRCEKYDVERKKKKNDHIPALFRERDKMLHAWMERMPKGGAPRVGIPRTMIFHEFLPFWGTFFAELGCEVVLSDKTNRHIIHKGVEASSSETCFPIKAAHGHVINLLKKDVDFIFLPMIVDSKKEHNVKAPFAFLCPYVQALPFMIKASFELEGMDAKLLHPIIAPGMGEDKVIRELIKMGTQLGKTPAQVRRAYREALKAQEEFYEAIKERGRQILDNLPEDVPAIVIVSRPYNGCDAGLNLDIPDKLRDLGALAIPMDFLPIEEVDISCWEQMYWRYGQRILAAGKFIHKHPKLHALYITNFGCGPDSFIIRFFQETMEDEPFLLLEIDEHSADAGIITRCEAFLDSLKNIQKMHKGERVFAPSAVFRKEDGRRLYIPRMYDGAVGIAAAFRAYGVDAVAFPPSNEETLYWGRKFTTGKECFPCIVTTGDIIRIVKSPDFDPKKAAIFMPSTNGPCRFGQYNKLQKLILDELGLEDVVIVSPNQGDNFYEQLGVNEPGFFRHVWQTIVAFDLLGKVVREIRPYEVRKGEADEVYNYYVERVEKVIESKGDLGAVMREAAQAFASIKVDRSQKKPVIGIVGEIFVRSHEFSNQYLVRQIEKLGGEAWLAPMQEWIYHINNTLRLTSRATGKWGLAISTLVKEYIQRRDETYLLRQITAALRNGHEAPIGKIWSVASKYLPPWFGEAALGAGKMADFYEKGASGVINVMPFTCLPGNIATAILKRVRYDYGGIPFLSIAYDGQDDPSLPVRLEAFMHQARQFMLQREAKEEKEKSKVLTKV